MAQTLPKLTMSRNDARARLLARSSIGKQFNSDLVAAFNSGSSGDYSEQRRVFDRTSSEYQAWRDYNSELLRRMFTSSEYRTQYLQSSSEVTIYGQNVTERAGQLSKRIVPELQTLDSIVDRLELIDEFVESAATTMKSLGEKNVFIVHGHDIQAQQTVARFLERCQIKPIILADQPDGGDTIIEKFEREASKASFAVVLLTADDVGQSNAEASSVPDSLRPRARQNVILELGYFVGFLGRKRVCALKKGQIELPSDYVGVVYTDMDLAEGWKVRLARELTYAGFDIDLNVALA